MALTPLIYTKDWTVQTGDDPRYFPTIETEESQVRADIQLLHDEAKDKINEIITTLGGSSAASEIGIETIPGSSADNLQDALDDLATDKANLNSPTFTGTPLITTTPTTGDDSHKIADTAFVQQELETIAPFIAIKGTTTYAEVTQAIADGKTVFAVDGTDFYIYAGVVGNTYIFTSLYAVNLFVVVTTTVKTLWLANDPQNPWSAQSINLAPLASPTFTGTPLITTTPTAGDDSHKIADTAFVQQELESSVAGASDYYVTINGTETYADVEAALTAGRTVYAKDSSGYVYSYAGRIVSGGKNNHLFVVLAPSTTSNIELKWALQPDMPLPAWALSPSQFRLAPIISPTFTGTPQITTTPATGDNTHKIADTAFVQQELAQFTPGTDTFMKKGVDYVTAGARSGSTLGSRATAEGNNVDASGNNSHAGGEYCKALGRSSFAMGYGVQAKQDYLMAFGMYNTDPGYQRSWIFIMNQMATYVDNYDGTAVLFFNVHDPDTTETINNALVFDVDYSGSDITLLYNRSRSVWGPADMMSLDPYLRVWDAQTTEPTQNLQLASRITAVPEYVHVQSPCYGLTIMYKNYQSNQVSDMESHMGYGTRLLETVGNGSSNNHSNARVLDWEGNEVLAGKLTVGAAPTANMDVATKKYVDDAIAAAIAALQQ